MPFVEHYSFCRYLWYTFLDVQDFEFLSQSTLVFHKNNEETVREYNVPSFTKTHNNLL